MLAMIAAPAGASAQSDFGDVFSSRAWNWNDGEGRGGGRSRKANNRKSITASTSLEEFDVPRRSARAYKSKTTRARMVERKRTQQRRVRVAALQRGASVGYINVAPQRRAVVKSGRKSRPASARQGTISPMAAPQPSLTGGGIAWKANASCLSGTLRSIIASVAARFGGVTVNSTCRSTVQNRRAGGAKRSWHLTGNAVDFRIRSGSVAALSAYVRGMVGGFKHYGGGLFHIDNGPKRSF